MTFQLLDSTAAADFVRMTFPVYRKLLTKLSPDGPVVAIGCGAPGSPLGLALGDTGRDACGLVLSIFVDKRCRSYGLGTALWQRMETALVSRGCTEIYVKYKKDGANVRALERLLAKSGWGKPEPYLLTCRVEGREAVERLMTAKWLRTIELSPDYEIFSWENATAEDHKHAGHIGESLHVSDDVRLYDEGSKFDPLRFDPLNSVGLRQRGTTVGCMLTQRASPGLMLYDNMFVAAEHQRNGTGIALVAEAIRRQYSHDRDIPTVGGCWRSQLANFPMIRFIRRRLGPYLTSEMETMLARKSIHEK